MIITDNSAVIANLQAKLARYEEALRFYADKNNWQKRLLVYRMADFEETVSIIEEDNGETARKALKEGGK